MVGDDAVHLFRAVQRAEPVAGLHMIDGNVELYRRLDRLWARAHNGLFFHEYHPHMEITRLIFQFLRTRAQ